ncbi:MULTISPECIES: secretion protein EspA [Chromobacterium]|uniref:Probable secreted protein EspA n=1 Tax=Chromobacterium violaceum (strain ATCC 12472 / DSM 30191 / JCM 1249 / CCUG 213 / NBRC 12614 / NCIMB 9131 / NCTC 9757 / MK) TaxID=243365 RepID=Q7NUW7_CHRVO|nr:secretion protein EspA [Chromobacterium violaceum]AAQ60250.1 probable secreted protein EspA [Chromobacterium violaceum ATCC 12472]SUX35778.1 Secretion system effector B [Chromobacterium violaceum]
MSTAISSISSFSNGQVDSVGKAGDGDNIDYLRAARNYSLLGQAIATMEEVMLLFTELSNAKFAQMSKKMEVSRDAQEMANKVEAVLAGITDPKDTKKLPQDVLDYLKANGISVDSVENLEGDLSQADLTAVKSALESFSGRASDFVQQSQLKMQQLIQNFNTAVTMANSLQSMNAESTKSIAQAIR